MELNQKIIDASYKLMEMLTKGYQWYHDTPEQPFEYSEGSIWLINPETGEWILELEKSGVLWYEYEIPDSFSKYLNMGISDFQSFIKIWVEDALKRGVSSTDLQRVTIRDWVEDALKRGVSSTVEPVVHRRKVVEDALKRGVSSIISEWKGIQRHQGVKDAVEKGTVTTVKLGEWSQVGVGDVIKNGNTIKNQEI
jgi:hypothetical protein